MSNGFNFLFSSERSGSNLITKILDNHPKICGPSPTHLLRFMAPVEWTYGNFNQQENWRKFVEDVITLFNYKISIWDISISFDELFNCEPKNLASLFKYIYFKEAEANKKESVFVKENHAYNLYPYYKHYFPGSKFVWLVRDPRDMALSFKKNLIHRGGIVRASQIWEKDQCYTLALRNCVSTFEDIYLIKYEEILTSPEKTIQNLCAFLEIEYSSEMVSRMGSNKNNQINASASIGWKNIGKGLLSKNFNKYREELSEDEIKFIESHCYSTMVELGYSPEYEKMDKTELTELTYELSIIEPYQKEGYQSIGKEEIEKRKRWMQFTKSLTRRTLINSD